MEAIISLKNVSKFFNRGKVIALNNINVDIKRGEFVVIAGPNGSGKSTLLKLICGLLIPDRGRIEIFGFNTVKYWKRILRRVGVLFAGERNVYWKLTGRENLEIFGGIYGVPKSILRQRIDYLLEILDLKNDADRLVEEYSTGMRRKLMLAKALIHDPEILLLDEVFSGLDPKIYRDVIRLLVDLNKHGRTIIVVSHLLHELPSDARLIVLKAGEIVFDGKIVDIKSLRKVKIVAKKNGEEQTYLVDEEKADEIIAELRSQGASEIRLIEPDIYDLVRDLI